MDSYYVALGSAIWLGILTSISPCPLASNIAAISYIGKRLDRPAMVLWSGIMYTIGRTLTYIAIGALVVASVLSVPEIAMFLQRNINKALGPILVIVGILLLGLFNPRFPRFGAGDSLAHRIEKRGIWGAGALGFLFALSFCPVSAALFFGSLIPLAIEHRSAVIMPTVFGIGTALPVVVFAIIIAQGAKWLGGAFDKISAFEKWARRITAIAFILAGLYYSAIYIAGLDI